LEDRLVLSSVYFVSDSAGEIFRVDPQTGTAAFQCATNVGPLYDIAASPSGAMYGASQNGNLYQINLNTGAATLVGSFHDNHGQAVFVNGLEFNKDGTLYASGNNVIYRVSAQNAACQAIVIMNQSYQSAGDLAFDGSGNVFLTTANAVIVEANLTSGNWLPMGTLQYSDFYGLAMSPDGQLYGFRSTGDVYLLNNFGQYGSIKYVSTLDSSVISAQVDGATMSFGGPTPPPASAAVTELTMGYTYGVYAYAYGSHSQYALYAYVFGYWAQYFAQQGAADHTATDWYNAYIYGHYAAVYAYLDAVTTGDVFGSYAYSWDSAGDNDASACFAYYQSNSSVAAFLAGSDTHHEGGTVTL
jgi:hypothetical protein